jgi:hypothetical protein
MVPSFAVDEGSDIYVGLLLLLLLLLLHCPDIIIITNNIIYNNKLINMTTILNYTYEEQEIKISAIEILHSGIIIGKDNEKVEFESLQGKMI